MCPKMVRKTSRGKESGRPTKTMAVENLYRGAPILAKIRNRGTNAREERTKNVVEIPRANLVPIHPQRAGGWQKKVCKNKRRGKPKLSKKKRNRLEEGGSKPDGGGGSRPKNTEQPVMHEPESKGREGLTDNRKGFTSQKAWGGNNTRPSECGRSDIKKRERGAFGQTLITGRHCHGEPRPNELTKIKND